MKPMWHSAAFAVLALGTQVAGAGPATTSIHALVNAGGYGILEESIFDSSSTGFQSWSGSAGFSSPSPTLPGNGGSSASATADFGVLKAAASSACSGGCGAAGSVGVSFSDEVIIDRADLHGQIGYLTTNVEFLWVGTAVNAETVADGVRFASFGQASIDITLSGLGAMAAGELVAAGGPSQLPRLEATDPSGTVRDVPFGRAGSGRLNTHRPEISGLAAA